MPSSMQSQDHARVTSILGDYKRFFSDLLSRAKALGIGIQGMRVGHLIYRTMTMEDYTKTRDALLALCKESVEKEFNARPISILVLREPLMFEEGFECSIIELTAPKASTLCPSGLDGVGMVAEKQLKVFLASYRHLLTGIKGEGTASQQALITFDNGKTVKFYDCSLKDIVMSQGWIFESTQKTL